MYSDTNNNPKEVIIKLPDDTIVLGTKSDLPIQPIPPKQNVLSVYKLARVLLQMHSCNGISSSSSYGSLSRLQYFEWDTCR